jgi:hypothetical protein
MKNHVVNERQGWQILVWYINLKIYISLYC